MKKSFFKIGLIALASLLFVTTSCSDEGFETIEESNTNQLPKNVLSKIKDLQMNPERFNYSEVTLFDGTIKKAVVIGEDISMSLNRFLAIPTNGEGLSTKQYQTQFLINTNVFSTVDVIAFVGEGPLALSQSAQEGLVEAVNNWNDITRTGIELTLTFTSEINGDFSNFEIFVNTSSTISGDGMADFPDEEGRPGSYVLISDRVTAPAQFSDGYEHLLTHELGHALGFRHSDWNSRQSCVNEGIESQTSEEPNPPSIIFGTLLNIPGVLEQENSIMNACFNFRTTDGELNFFDESGFRSLYPRRFF